MDKKRSCYCRGNQELTIESMFVTDTPVEEVIKEYIMEARKNRVGMAVQKTECDNKSNMIVAAPAKGDCQ